MHWQKNESRFSRTRINSCLLSRNRNIIICSKVSYFSKGSFPDPYPTVIGSGTMLSTEPSWKYVVGLTVWHYTTDNHSQWLSFLFLFKVANRHRAYDTNMMRASSTLRQLIVYYMSKKSWPNLYSYLLYRMFHRSEVMSK